MEIRNVTDRISYLPAVEKPLSADIGIIRCDDKLWIYDVGSSGEAAEAINALAGPKNIVLSHFHTDHAGNIDHVAYDMLYAGAFTCRKLGKGSIVDAPLRFENGIHIFPLPSGHAKGCVGLEYGDYAFLGDAVYSMEKNGKAAYNAGLLKELITVLKSLRANLFLLSHREPFARPRAGVIMWLEEIYARRDRNEPYIFL